MAAFAAAIRAKSDVVDTNKTVSITGDVLCNERRVAWRNNEG